MGCGGPISRSFSRSLRSHRRVIEVRPKAAGSAPTRLALRRCAAPGHPLRVADPALAVESTDMVRALVTGGSRGLGFEVARGLIAQGVATTILGQSLENVARASSQLGATGITCDVRDYESLKNIRSQHEPFDIIVLSHGVMSEKMSKTMKATKEDWDRTVDINLTGVFNVVNLFADYLVEKRNGRVIVFSACLGRMSGPGNAGGLAPYRVSKAGVNAFVRNFAHETGLGARGVLVDAICPNHSQTDMGGANAPRTAAEGAETAIWLATREFTPGIDQTGLLWEDREVVPW